jgi:uncharacterized membrane protein
LRAPRRNAEVPQAFKYKCAMRARAIKATSVLARTMPLGNGTRMTHEERARLGPWVNQGARTDIVARQ